MCKAVKKLLAVLVGLSLFSFGTKKVSANYIANYNVPTDYKNVGSPINIIRESNGDIWYADSENFRIVKIDSNGNILRTVGRQGNDEGEFAGSVRALTQDNEGNLFVLYGNCFVDKLDYNGGFLQFWNKCSNDTSFLSGIHFDTYSKTILVSYQEDNNQTVEIIEYDKDGNQLSTFGSFGQGEGQFYLSTAIANDAGGNIYVADQGDFGVPSHYGHRVVVFKADHTADFSFDTYIDANTNYQFPDSIDVLNDGNIVVASGNGNFVRLYSPEGVYIRDLTTSGNGDGQTHYPEGLAHDTGNNIFFGDALLNRLQEVSENSDFIWKWGNSGSDLGHFSSPTSVAYDSTGNLYVLSSGTDDTGMVQKFTNSGTYISTVISHELPHGQQGMAIHHDQIYIATDGSIEVYTISGNYVTSMGSYGTGDGQFVGPRNIAFDSNDNMYVTDTVNYRIEVFDASGNYLKQWSTNIGGKPAEPDGIYIDGNDNIWVTANGDTYNDPEPRYHGIEEFSTSGDLINSFDRSDLNHENSIKSVYVDSVTGDIYFSCDDNQNSITVIDSNGNWLYDIGSYGSGDDQFSQPGQIVENPVTHTLTVDDVDNQRIVDYAVGVKIQNLIPSADVVRTSDDFSLASNYISPEEEGINDINSQMDFGAYAIATFNVDLSTDRDWAAVNAITLPDISKALVVNLNPTDAPGVSDTHSLYVVKQEGQTSVRVCPNATTIEDITMDCDGGYTLNDGDDNLSTVTINGVDYWKIDELTGTGAMSPVINSYNITAPQSSISVGDIISISITATDNAGSTYTGYTGTVHISADPGTATLPDDYTFTEADQGTHTFSGISFQTPGTYTLTLTDTVHSSRTQSIVIVVTSSGSSSEGGSSNSPTSPPSVSSCTDSVPATAPNLFKINTNANSATLIFTPVDSNETGYSIAYGFSPGDDRYAVSFDQGHSSGALSYTISGLNSDQAYSFKVRAIDGCVVGPWSNYLSIGPHTGSILTSASPEPTPTPTTGGGITLTPTPEPTSASSPISPPKEIPPIVISKGTVKAAETVTKVGSVITGAAVVGSAVVGTIAMIGTITTTLLPIYAATARPLINFPFDLMGSLFSGIAGVFVGFFGPIFGFVKKKGKQGTVFDGFSDEPLSGAYIVMFSQSGNLKTAFSDSDGRYSATLRPDIYSLRAEKDNYIFPSKLVTVSSNGSFNHIYLPGERFEVKPENENVFDIAIPMDPNTNIPSTNKLFIKVGNSISYLIKKLGVPLEIISFGISAFAAYFDTGIFYKAIFIGISIIYLFQLISAIKTKSTLNLI